MSRICWNSILVVCLFFLCIFDLGFIGAVNTDGIPIEVIAEGETSSRPTDEITVKQIEMRNTTVLVTTIRARGSGTIIDRLEIEEGIFEYRVLTNAHVTYSRFIRYLRGVNSITGRVQTETVDTGCNIITFDYVNMGTDTYLATVVAEDITWDLAILSLRSTKEFDVAEIASEDMLENVRVFDEIFAIGCQLGQAPIPTTGIVSQIITGNNGERRWAIYANTAQITPGSSGGGLFKEYNGHYYLIGIPFRVSVMYNGQIVPHLSQAISIATASDFLDKNSVTLNE